MTVVIDASVLFAGLTKGGEHSEWARSFLNAADTVSPELALIEVAQIVRRAVLSGVLTSKEGWLLLEEARDVIDTFVPHASLLKRVWELHTSATSYDAVYVALAERLGAPLATLDRRLARAPGITCEFLVPA